MPFYKINNYLIKKKKKLINYDVMTKKENNYTLNVNKSKTLIICDIKVLKESHGGKLLFMYFFIAQGI